MGLGCVFLCMEHGLVGPTYMGVGPMSIPPWNVDYDLWVL